MRNLILTGGIRHNFTDNTEAVVGLLSAAGISSESSVDIEAGIERLATESFDLLTVMALRWRMEGDTKYAPHRAQYAYTMSPECRTILKDFIKQGGGLFGLHTACLCFDDWPEWQDILGGVWVWGQSFHPPHGPVSVSLTREKHPITAGLPEFNLTDEVYSGLSLSSGVIPLLTAQAGQGSREPVLWTHCPGNGRVVFDSLGHDRSSLEHKTHSRLIQRCAAWAGGSADEAVGYL